MDRALRQCCQPPKLILLKRVFVSKFAPRSIENRIKSNKNFGHVLRAIFYTYCYYNFNPSGIFAHLTSFSLIRIQVLEQGQVMAAVNSRK